MDVSLLVCSPILACKHENVTDIDHNSYNMMNLKLLQSQIAVLFLFIRTKDGESSIFLKVDWGRIVLDEAHTIKNWRTMSARAAFTLSAHCRPILVLPPTDIQVIECEQSEAEHGFYDALYKKSLPGSGKKFSS
nr:putative SWI/SNF-related matrix-associated actin-dependent regulator of chromatin subfamily A member 3-like 3 [Ipomoea batatas]